MSFQFISPVYAADNSWTGACIGDANIGTVNAGVNASDVATIQGITCLIQNILKPVPSLIALAAVFIIILAGTRIISAGSDPKALAAAWASFTWAIIGLILLSAVWIVLIIIKNITGVDITNFTFQ
jgi:hypothetical protein